MWWILLAAWVLLAPLLGLLIGAGIRLAGADPSDLAEVPDEVPCRRAREFRPASPLAAGAQQ